MLRILHVDDDPDYLYVLDRAMAQAHPQVELVGVQDFADGCKRAAAGPWSLVVVDYYLPGAFGGEAAAGIMVGCTQAPVVVLTGRPLSPADHLTFAQMGCVGALTKPECPFEASKALVGLAREVDP